MDKLEIFGAKKLRGKISISGSKNAALPILAATILSDRKIILKNLPNVKDIVVFLVVGNNFLERREAIFENSLRVFTSKGLIYNFFLTPLSFFCGK